MIDVIFEGMIESIEKFWFQLNLRFDLENSDSFLALQRLWNMALENPVILLGAVVILIGIPIGLYQSRKAQAGKEKRMDQLMGELEGDAGSKPLFADEMQPPQDDGDTDFISMNSFLGKEFSGDLLPELDNNKTAGRENPELWNKDDLSPSSAPLHKDFGSLTEPPFIDEEMDLEPSTNGTREIQLHETAGAENDADTIARTESALDTTGSAEDELDKILDFSSSIEEIDLSSEIEEAISAIEGTLEEIQQQKNPGTETSLEAPSEDLVDLGYPEEADIEPVEESIGVDSMILEANADEPLTSDASVETAEAVEEDAVELESVVMEDSDEFFPMVAEEESLEGHSLEPELATAPENGIPGEEHQTAAAATAEPQSVQSAKPARNSKDLMDRLLKFQDQLEKRMAALGTDEAENSATNGDTSTPQEKKIFEPVNMKNPEENTDPKAKSYQELLESYFLANKQNKNE